MSNHKPVNRRLLQLALDLGTLDEALAAAAAAADGIDVIEAGTLLCVAEGMHAVKALRRAHPDRIIVADIRIARAGRNLAAMAFDAGADWVSAVGEAPAETLASAAKVARERGADLQVELPERWDDTLARSWKDMGIRHVIVHCTAEVQAIGSGWTAATVSTIDRLAGMGFIVTAAGGIDAATLPGLLSTRAMVFVAGRSIVNALDPRAEALRMRALLA
ncbi:MAG: orotidine 5'-phosphate decarboxylase [Steroidobacteraceae bacterium]|nr:orotidine 5'-phosphate decarboxylase [Steroidobacteraceae bacterium]